MPGFPHVTFLCIVFLCVLLTPCGKLQHISCLKKFLKSKYFIVIITLFNSTHEDNSIPWYVVKYVFAREVNDYA